MPPLPVPTPTHGTASTLFALSPAAKLDIQGHIAGQYTAAIEKGHEYTHPTGKRFVFFLRLGEERREEVTLSEEARVDLEGWIAGEDDDVWAGEVCGDDQEEDDDNDNSGSLSTIEEEDEGETGLTELESSFDVDATEATATSAEREAKRKERLERSKAAPSLAYIIATARPEDFPISSQSDSDEDSASASDNGEGMNDAVYKLEDDFTATTDGADDLELGSDEDGVTDSDSDDELPTTYTTNEHERNVSPQKDIVHQHTHTFRPPLQRHNGAVTLATLIARAESAVFTTTLSPSPFFSSSLISNRSSFSPPPHCLDPSFSGHTVCHRRDQDVVGLTVADAIDTLRYRFDVRHEGGEMGMRKAWHLKKREMKGGMVYGGSDLRSEIVVDDDEENEIEINSSPFPTIKYSDELDSMLSSSFDEDVDGSGDELNASGIYGSDEGVLEESSSLFDEHIEDYDDRVISAKTSRETGHLASSTNIFAELNVSTPPLALHHNTFPSSSLHATSSKDDLEVRYAASSLHNTISTDSSDNTSSIRTLLFSNRTSLTSKTSSSSVRSAYSRLIDALDLEIDRHKCQNGCGVCVTALRGFSVATINFGRENVGVWKDRKRVVSLPVVPVPSFD